MIQKELIQKEFLKVVNANKYLVEIIYLKKQKMIINGKLKQVLGFKQSFNNKKKAKSFLNVFLAEDKLYKNSHEFGLIDSYSLRKNCE